MPTLEVKPGISLAYVDSGVPKLSPDVYMTVFALHGGTFYTPFFNRAIAVSSRYNIRLIAITRRDYPDSSLLTDEDVKAVVEGPTEKRLQALAERGEEILRFIERFIEINDIPPINLFGGGFSLLAWSLGNADGLSTLAFANNNPDIVERLGPYFRSYILFETVPYFPLPLGTYHPFRDHSIPKAELEVFFSNWLSSHFIHSAEGLASGDHARLNQKTPVTTKPSTFAQLTAEERETMLDSTPSLRADVFYYRLDQAVNDNLLQRAFIQQGPQTLPAWPNVPVKALWGDETVWLMAFSHWELEKWLLAQRLEAEKSGYWARPFETTCVSGGNHFFQWEEPNRFVETIKRLMV